MRNTRGMFIPRIRLIVLIPHRDHLKPLRSYSRSLFAAGFPGAFSFPHVAPLAFTSRPLAKFELKELALSLRALSMADGRDGKSRTGPAESLSCPQYLGSSELTLFGPVLDLPSPPLSGFPPNTVVYRFPFLTLCAALIGSGEEQHLRASREAGTLPGSPSGFFRAAAVANMRLWHLPSGEQEYSWAWKIGEPVWLPSYRLSKKERGSSPGELQSKEF